MAAKPTIASPVFEYDSRLGHGLSLPDLATIVTWPDQSVQVNNGIAGGSPQYLLNGWQAGIPAVKMLGVTSDLFTFTGTAFNNSNLTLFFVVEATDITNHLAIIGDNSASAFPRRVTVFIRSDGSVIFTFSKDPYEVRSAVGVVKSGDRLIISARFSTTTGMILRVGRTQVAADLTQTTAQIGVDVPRLGFVNDSTAGGIGSVFGIDKRYGWASSHSLAASDLQIEQMEAFLFQEFFGTVWSNNCAPSPATPWSPCS